MVRCLLFFELASLVESAQTVAIVLICDGSSKKKLSVEGKIFSYQQKVNLWREKYLVTKKK